MQSTLFVETAAATLGLQLLSANQCSGLGPRRAREPQPPHRATARPAASSTRIGSSQEMARAYRLGACSSLSQRMHMTWMFWRLPAAPSKTPCASSSHGRCRRKRKRNGATSVRGVTPYPAGVLTTGRRLRWARWARTRTSSRARPCAATRSLRARSSRRGTPARRAQAPS